MENQTRNDEIEIDLLEVFNILISRAWIIIGAGLLLSLTAFAISKFVLTPTYKSTTKIYILNKTESQTVTYSDVQIDRKSAADKGLCGADQQPLCTGRSDSASFP